MIAAGWYHTVVIKSDGSIACWGHNQYAQCEVPEELGFAVKVSAGLGHTVALLADGTIACWGDNGSGQCNIPADLNALNATTGVPTPIADIEAAGNRTMVRLCKAPSFERHSGNLGAIGFNAPRAFTFTALPAPVGSATLTIRARGDFDLTSEFLTLRLNGVLRNELLFAENANDCPSSPDSIALALPYDELTALLSNGSLTVGLEASRGVSATQCNDALCEISLRYESVAEDCNANGVLDSCEIATGAPDADADRVLDECEYARGDFNLDGQVGTQDLDFLLSNWGAVNPDLGDINGDGVIAVQDLVILLHHWGPY